MPPTESAVIVPVHEAEDVVGGFRVELDRSASWGVPAHVTVLYPFLPPGDIDDQVLDALAAAVATVPAFAVALARTASVTMRRSGLSAPPRQPSNRDCRSAPWSRRHG